MCPAVERSKVVKYWVIEHPSRGVYVGFDRDVPYDKIKPRFRWSILRTEGVKFFHAEAARREMAKIVKAGVDKCYFVALTRRGLM
jgi:hypothetical protein